ncbi:MAG: hypothetical protein M3010_06440 [Candidatus Dormibacteraeota bacterium]|nr:hypothetical protein [Candidatus Dormibacteraeota bacterium]
MILRCTGKLLTLLGRRPVTLPTPAPSDDDWYANLMWLDRRKCLLLVHAGTLFPVFGADVRKAAITPIGDAIVRLVHTELVEEGLPPDTFGELDQGAVILARTASRVVLGHMNEMATYCEYFVRDAGGLGQCDIGSLNRGLRRELHLTRQPPGHLVPIDAVHARLQARV